MNKISINSKEYTISPLRCKHLRMIAKILEASGSGSQRNAYSDIERWMPFILASIQIAHPNTTMDDVEEMTLEEFAIVWNAITEISGYKFVPKGETMPTAELGGTSSMGESAPPSAGPTLM